MGGFEKVALKKAADDAALEFRKTISMSEGASLADFIGWTKEKYPADRYNLDLALILSDNRKLDIEVDGEMYHRNWNKELSYRDQLRNQRMFELGWDVKRFWVFQIRDDLEWCVSEIKKWCESCS